MIHSRERTLQCTSLLGLGDTELFAGGKAPCVVAFHGFGGTATELRPLLDEISRAGFAVDAALLPGHGTSADELAPMTFDRWVEAGWRQVRAATARHGRVVLIGFSLGSLVAMQIASERPPGVEGLVVLGNALRLSLSTRLPLGLVARLVARLGVRVPDVYVLKSRVADLVEDAAIATLVTYDRHPLRAALEVYRAGARVRGRVGRIECATLILHGRRDRVCPWRNATWLAAHIGARDVRVRIFDKSAHVLACDGERDEVSREVTEFIARAGVVA
jgi:carboxylesterase